MRSNVTMPVCMAMLFKEIIDSMLYTKEVDKKNKVKLVPRDIPFNLRYKLNLNKSLLENIIRAFEEDKTKLVVNYGEANGEVVSIREECIDKFKEDIDSLLNSEVTILVEKFEQEDFDDLRECIDISEDAFKAFYCYMVEDVEYIKALQTKINLKKVPAKKTTKTVKKSKKETQKVEEIVEPVKESPKAKKSVKKTTEKVSKPKQALKKVKTN